MSMRKDSLVLVVRLLKVREEREGKGADCCSEGVADHISDIG